MGLLQEGNSLADVIVVVADLLDFALVDASDRLLFVCCVILVNDCARRNKSAKG